MDLEDLGFNINLEKFRTDNNLNINNIGRVIAVHKERFIVKTVTGEFEAEITGNMRFTAKSFIDFPTVGDWVSMIIYDSDFAIIHSIFPRFSLIKRQSVGRHGEVQLIAANVNYAFLVQSAERDFNLNRLERYLTICNSSGIVPIALLTKIDLISEDRLSAVTDSISRRMKNLPVYAISNETRNGYEAIKNLMENGKTYCMLGSSGVGKSTLLNNLYGRAVMRTDEISHSTNKGKHVTSHRELVVLEEGGILIDNPGMREVGIADDNEGLELTFDLIIKLSENCKFINCTHTVEAGCSVLDALERDELESSYYENYLKMQKEKAYFESTLEERRKKDKIFGKMFKNYKKGK